MTYIEVIRNKYNCLHASQETIDKTALVIFEVSCNLTHDPNVAFEAVELVLSRRVDAKEQDVLSLWFLVDPTTALANLQARRAQEAGEQHE